MAASLDNLNIQISASTAKAVTSVNNLVTALEKLKTALGQIDTKGLEECSKAAENLGGATVRMKDSVKTFKKLTKAVAEVSNQTEPLTKSADKAKDFADNVSAVAESTKNATREIGGNTTNGFQRFLGEVKDVAGNLKNLNLHTGKATNFFKKLGSSSKKTSTSAGNLAKELLRVGKMMKLMITRMVLRKIISGIGDGFKNLAQYSSKVNASMSLLWNSFRQLGNSIAAAASPLLNAFAPALNAIIQLVIKAVNAINQLISAMLGLGVWTRAKTLTDDYAKSLDKASGSAKELKKTVLGFDELNQLQDNKNKGGGTTDPTNMFEEVAVEKKWKDLAGKLLDPFKRAWARVGDYVKKSWKKALDNVKKLGKDVANDFLEVWNQPRTVQMLEDMLRIVGNIGQFVGNLANSFDKAWNKAEVGKRIFENIRNLCADIVAGIEDITLSWALWASKVNFTPLLEGLAGFTESLDKPVKAVMGVLSDLNDHFIQPVAKWLIEEGIPSLIQVFTDFNNSVDWDKIRDRLDRVWQALAPFAIEVGKGLVEFIGRVSEKVGKFLNSDKWDAFIDTLIKWMEKVDADDIADGLTAIATALIAYKSFTWLSSIAAGLKTFFAIFTGGTAAEAAGGMTTIGNALLYLGSALAGAHLGSTIADAIEIPWFETTLRGVAAIGEKFGFDVTEINAAAANVHNLGEEYKGLGGKVRMVHDAWTGDINELTYTVRDANGEIIGSYKGGQEAVITFEKSTSDATKKAAQDTAAMTTKLTTDAGTLKRTYFEPVIKSTKDFGVTTQTETYNIKEAYAGATVSIQGDLKTLERSNKDTMSSIKKGFDAKEWTFSGVADGLRKTFEDAKNAIKGVWNDIADKLNGSHSIGGGSFHINLPKLYATGGFPEDGLFMANHNELVGRFSNGRTAVANNEQITAGIAQAVYSAMMASNSGGSQYINNTIEVDGVAIARAVTKGQRSLDRRYSPTMA